MGTERKRWRDLSDDHYPANFGSNTELTNRDRLNLERDIQYWKAASKRKDEEIKLLQNQIRGLKSHITRQKGVLHRKGVYKV